MGLLTIGERVVLLEACKQAQGCKSKFMMIINDSCMQWLQECSNGRRLTSVIVSSFPTKQFLFIAINAILLVFS